MALSAERVVEIARRLVAEDGSPVCVLWHVTESGRHGFADAIRLGRRGVPVVPVLAGAGFVDANSLATDLLRTLEENRDSIERELHQLTPFDRIVIVLLSRRSLATGGMPSPGRLPEWMPYFGGREVEITFRDSVRDIRAGSVADVEVGIADIRAALYEVDVALLRRIRVAIQAGEQEAKSAFERAGILPSTETESRCQEWHEWLQDVTVASAYRLDVKFGKSPLAMVVRMVTRTSPDDLSAKTAAFDEAVGPKETDERRVPLTALLYRAAGNKNAIRNGHALFITVFAAYNLINAAAHADRYPEYTLGILEAIGRDIRYGLVALREWLQVASH